MVSLAEVPVLAVSLARSGKQGDVKEQYLIPYGIARKLGEMVCAALGRTG